MISAKAQKNIELFSLWCGIAYVVLIFIGFWLLAGFLPPHSPYAEAAEIQKFYDANRSGIRAGMVLEMFAAAAFIPFTAVMAHYIAQVEGKVGILTISQIMGGMGNVMLTFYPAMWWLIASYRADIPPDILRFANDAGWLQFVGGLTPFYPILISIAVTAFVDRRPVPLFPRWVGYLNLWITVLFWPGLIIFFVKSGPFAWNGLLAFWLPLFVLGLWFAVMTYWLRRAVLRG